MGSQTEDLFIKAWTGTKGFSGSLTEIIIALSIKMTITYVKIPITGLRRA